MNCQRRPSISRIVWRARWRLDAPAAIQRQLTPCAPTPLSGHDRGRLIAFAKAGLAHKARELASTAEGNRNNCLFALGAGLGRYVFHGVLSPTRLKATAIAACRANGLLREDGRLAVLATLHSGIARAKDDPLPVLKERLENEARGARAGFNIDNGAFET